MGTRWNCGVFLLVLMGISVSALYSSRNHHIQEGIVDDELCKDGKVEYTFYDENNIPIIRCRHCKEIVRACARICSEPCKKCKICTCDKGYILDPVDKQSCLPIIHKQCENGDCIPPEAWQCDPGYSYVNSTCQPVCTEPCVNGTCVAPGICNCLLGYKKSGRNICKPYCANGCPHGSCVAPETCSCRSGWELTRETGCKPIRGPPNVCNNTTNKSTTKNTTKQTNSASNANNFKHREWIPNIFLVFAIALLVR